MKKIIIAYFAIRNAVRYIRKNYHLNREWYGYAICIGIVLGIVIDVLSAPLQYVSETVVPHVYAEESRKQVLIEVDYSNMTDERVFELIHEYATKYGVSEEKMRKTVLCENPDLDPMLQSLIVKKGVREDSWGLAQIWLPAHPEITKEQAQDPHFALDFMASEFSEGRAWKWTCYRTHFGK